MRVVCTEIASDGDAAAVVSFYTRNDDGDKPQKGMCKLSLPLEQARAFVVGEEYELLAPHVRPKVVKATAGKRN